MTAQATEQLSDARHRARRERFAALRIHIRRRGRRELPGIIRHHWTVTLSSRLLRTPARQAGFRPQHLRDIKSRATVRGLRSNLSRIKVLGHKVTILSVGFVRFFE